jgi:hypothetical protein
LINFTKDNKKCTTAKPSRKGQKRKEDSLKFRPPKKDYKTDQPSIEDCFIE